MEIWRDIIGYDGKYKISNNGNIKQLLLTEQGKNNFYQEE